MAITRSQLRAMKDKRSEAQHTRSKARAKRLRRHTTYKMTTLTIQVSETTKIGSFTNPHKFAESTKPVLKSIPDLVLLRSSDIHHVLVDRSITVQSPSLMRAIKGRSDQPVLAGVLAGFFILRIPYGVLLQALTFLHYRSTRPAEENVFAGEHWSDVRTIEDWILFRYNRNAGEKVLFEHGEKAFVYHLDFDQLEPLLKAALLLELQLLVDLIQERISSTKHYYRDIIRTILGLVDPSLD